MDFKKELGRKNRENFIREVKHLLDIDVALIDDAYLNKNPYRIYVKINRVGQNALLEYCRTKGYRIEYHFGDNAWITFDYDKMRKWYSEFNVDYHTNLRLYYANNADTGAAKPR